jgi:hypothetical protein
MVLGISFALFTAIHIFISVLALFSGFIVLYGLWTSQRMPAVTAFFLLTTIVTSVTGFPIPPFGMDPPRIVGIISLVALAVAVVALYFMKLRGIGRLLYIAGAVFALYLNTFVFVVQSFQKFPSIASLAPTQSEPPFLIVQVATLLFFVVAGLIALRKFHPPVEA